MIQRIQTFYLSISVLLCGLLFWLPLSEIAAGDVIYLCTVKGVTNLVIGEQVSSALHLLVFLGIIVFIQFLIIFGYKKRIRQMRMATYNILLMIAFVVICWFYIRSTAKNFGEAVYTLKLAVSFPLVAAILNYLAIRAIGRDEALVRSVDRIR
jgi:hypothetical protein